MGEGFFIYCGDCFEKMNEIERRIFIENLHRQRNSIEEICLNNKMFYKYLHLGIGYLFDSNPAQDYFIKEGSEKEPTIYKMIKEKQIKHDIKSFLEKGAIVTGGSWSIYYCEKCFEIYNKYDFKMENNGIIYEPEYICSECENKINEVKYERKDADKIIFRKLQEKIISKKQKGEIVKVICKECNSDNIIEDKTLHILWD